MLLTYREPGLAGSWIGQLLFGDRGSTVCWNGLGTVSLWSRIVGGDFSQF